MEKKKKYMIWISGEDFISTFREFTDAEAQLVKSVIDELETGREGCRMEIYPSDEELDDIVSEVTEGKLWLEAYRQNFENIISEKFPDKNILWQERVAYDVQMRVLRMKKMNK